MLMVRAGVGVLCALVVSTKVGEVSGHRRCQGRNGRCYGGQEGIQPHALCNGQSIELGNALQDMILSELACFVSRNQVPEELVSVIGHVAPPPAAEMMAYLTPHPGVESNRAAARPFEAR
jgi:hypothetical protein